MKSPEPVLELPPTAPQQEPDWQNHSRSEMMESVGISLWSWLLVGGLSLWFCFWLVKALARIAARI
jgi:hypothetical protein